MGDMWWTLEFVFRKTTLTPTDTSLDRFGAVCPIEKPAEHFTQHRTHRVDIRGRADPARPVLGRHVEERSEACAHESIALHMCGATDIGQESIRSVKQDVRAL